MSRQAPRRRSAPPDFLAQEIATKEADKIEKKQARAATRESSLTAYQAYSTELLFHWGSDCKGWSKKVPASKSTNRDLIIRTLLDGEVDPPRDMKAIIANWKKLNKTTKYGGSGRHSDSEEEASDDDDEEMEVSKEESDGDEPAASSTERPAKRQRTNSTELDHDTRKRCPHCLIMNQLTFCEGCGMRRDKDWTDPQNADIRNKKDSSSSGKSNSTDTSNKDLSKRDRELERLTAAGDPFTSFITAKDLSAKEALERLTSAHMGTSYVPPSKSLIKHIQSGKLVDIGYATPITISEAQAAKQSNSSVQTLSTGENGEVKVVDTSRPPPLASMQQLIFTSISVILPSLIDNKTGLTEWLSLLRTAMQLEKDKGWISAKEYVERALQHCIHQRAPFGGVVRECMDSILFNRAPASSATASSSMSKKSSRRASPAGGHNSDSVSEELCHNFNNSRCRFGEECKFKHICKKCASTSHGARDCKKKSPATMPPLDKPGASNRPGAYDYFGKSKSDSKSD